MAIFILKRYVNVLPINPGVIQFFISKNKKSFSFILRKLIWKKHV